MLDYRTHVKKGSMFNTPPVLPIFSALQTLRYYKEIGGIKEMERRDLAKAEMLYEAIDSSRMFVGTVELEKAFIDFATSKGIVGIKGHRSVGGFRASLYNALPIESVKVLVDAMHQFEKDN